jgi:hypothetical protein
MKLPGRDHAVVDLAKLRDCCLNDQHPRGRHKARVFASVLGLTGQDSEFLRDALLRAAAKEEATLVEHDDYGQRYMLDFMVTSPGGSGMIRSSWIVLAGESRPRLVTSYVL